jgi:hypothetical protein
MFDKTIIHLKVVSHRYVNLGYTSPPSFYHVTNTQLPRHIKPRTMANLDDSQMTDANDSSGLFDDTRSEIVVGDRPKGSALRQRHQLNINESADDYTDLFRSLQLQPELYERFLDGVLKVIRQKNIKELQRGTDASIRHLSSLVLRGYRTIVWKEGSEWLLGDLELDEGEERLLHGRDNER